MEQKLETSFDRKAEALHKKLAKAWGGSTKNDNQFRELVEATKWDSRFTQDGEEYYGKNGLLMVCKNLDPFDGENFCNINMPDGSLFDL